LELKKYVYMCVCVCVCLMVISDLLSVIHFVNLYLQSPLLFVLKKCQALTGWVVMCGVSYLLQLQVTNQQPSLHCGLTIGTTEFKL